MEFVALDVETANANLASICQIGIVRFSEGRPTDQWSSLVNPQADFDAINVAIHGIEERDVVDAPTWPDVIEEVRHLIGNNIVVCHGSFDRSSTNRASTRFGIQPLQCQWLDSCCVARRAWPDVSQRGYGLGALADRFAINFEHHNAVEDARASGLILAKAINDTGIDLSGWLQRVRQPIDANAAYGCHAMAGNPEGPFQGETIAFTGELRIPRHEAALLASAAGCHVGDNVTKKTTILVVGDQDIDKLRGESKSSKHRRAEELIAKGQAIRIITESDFAALVTTN